MMKTDTRSRSATLAVLAFSLAGSVPFTAGADPPLAPRLSVEPVMEAASWTVRYGPHVILEYAFPRMAHKPYVRRLATLDGGNLLRDAPADHLHHHGLMYAVGVNGLNFWEELPGSGIQKPVNTGPPELGFSSDGRPEARLRQTLHWLASSEAFLPDDPRHALMIEERALTLALDPARGEVSLHWRSEFVPGGRTRDVTLSGSSYFGLGLRFAADLDPVAGHFRPGGSPDLADGRQEVSVHPWSAVFFDRPGRPVTLALIGHPANPRGDPAFFTMTTPFAYLSATQGLDLQPLVLRAGTRFRMDYLIVVTASARSPESIGERARTWRDQPPPPP